MVIKIKRGESILEVRVANVVDDSIVDGPGIRTVIFFQGCAHHCAGCFNSQTWDFNGGNTYTVDELTKRMLANPLSSGVTFSGGDPVYQVDPLTFLARVAQEHGKSTWLYTGFTYDEVLRDHRELLQYIDVMVDGPFMLRYRDLNLRFRGSANQRVIDVKRSLSTGIVTWLVGYEQGYIDPMQQ